MGHRFLWLLGATVVVAVAMMVVASVLPGCSDGRVPPEVRDETRLLLAEHQLHSAGPGRVSQVELTSDDAFSLPVLVASRASGFDLSAYARGRVSVLRVPLRERSQSLDGDIEAVFAYEATDVIGAYLTLAGYVPGAVALDDRSLFLPNGVGPRDLHAGDVARLTVAADFDGFGWTRSVQVTDAPTIARVVSVVEAADADSHAEASPPTAVGPTPAASGASDGEYVLRLTYATGEELQVRLQDARGPRVSVRFDAEAFGEGPLSVSDDVLAGMDRLLETAGR